MPFSHLKPEIYANPSTIVAIGFKVRGKVPCFTGTIAEKATAIVGSYLETNHIKHYGWIVLPESVELVISPTKTKNIFMIVEDLKKALKKSALPAGREFFDDFFDHVLRSKESPQQMATERFERAVNLSLCDSWEKYPFLCAAASTQ